MFFVLRSQTINAMYELWRSDGTEAGTILVKEIQSQFGDAFDLTDVDGTLFFVASDSIHGEELWKSDGTIAGTVQVANINLISGGGSSPTNLTNVNGCLFFSADDAGRFGRELWKSDGTEVGTVVVKDINLTTNASQPDFLADVDGTLFLSANDGVHGRELWKTDGTVGGTVLVKDIVPGSLGGYPGFMTNVNGTAFFTANDGIHGTELWKSDGTEVGTKLVKDIRPESIYGNRGSYPRFLTNVNGTLFFVGDFSQDLWKSDGTEAGTVLVKNGTPSQMTAVGDLLFFTLDDGVHGNELWKSNGTESGTVLVKDINTKTTYGVPTGSNPNWLTNVNGTLFFAARDGAHGIELWKNDGTEIGTMMVRDIDPEFGGYQGYVPLSSSPSGLINVNGTLFFTAHDSIHGNELWKSDGTAAGTTMVKDIRSEASYGGSYPTRLTNVNGILFFTATNNEAGHELWKSDGTEGGTVLVRDIRNSSPYYVTSSDPGNLIAVGDTLLFSADDGVHGRELWLSDGTASGTVLVADLNANGNSYLNQLTTVGGQMFFSTVDGRLWVLRPENASPNGDFNRDHLFNCADIDTLIDEILAGSDNPSFDLTGDDDVDRTDLDLWLAEAAVANGFPQPYVRGDATLDGKVDALDLNVVGLNWKRPASGWCRGDFSADGVVNATDLDQLAINWRANIAPAAAAGPVADAALEAVLGQPALRRTPRAPLAAMTLPAIAKLGHEALAPSPGQVSLSVNTSNGQPRHPFAQAIASQQLAATDAARFGMSQASIRRYSVARLSPQAVNNARDWAIVQIADENAATTNMQGNPLSQPWNQQS